jgi:hypothetical protein
VTATAPAIFNDAMTMTTTVTVGTGPLTCDEVVAVARHGAPVALADEALPEIARGRDVVDALAHDRRAHYGVSTGFGALAQRHIPADRRQQLQRSLIRSHAAGTGPEVEREVVRALMLLRLSTLATGRTGVRVETAEAYAAMLSAGITPVVHEHGSLGCSGDLAPLAHCALALMGEGPVRDADGERRGRELDAGAAPGDGDDLLGTQRCRTDGDEAGGGGRDGGHGLIPHRGDAGRQPVVASCVCHARHFPTRGSTAGAGGRSDAADPAAPGPSARADRGVGPRA